jgi:inward rectifier potassium channel
MKKNKFDPKTHIRHHTRAPVPRIIQGRNTSFILKIGRSNSSPFRDVFHWLMNRDWWQLISLIFSGFIISNSIFALIYYSLPNGVSNTHGRFIDYFFFSVQTMATIGYGVMAPQTTGANLVSAFEAFVGLIGFAVGSGVIFGRLAKPTAKILFSQVGAISKRNGVDVLTFRLANERDNQILEGSVSMSYLSTKNTKEGETLRRFEEMKLERHRTPIFTLTWTLVHPIDSESPLNGKTADHLIDEQAEILVTFRGVDETFSQEIFARSSYIADEIHWGHRFVDILGVDESGMRTIDYNKFHETQPWAL